MHNYGAELKYQREIAGLNQPELALKIGTSQANISRWERGEVLPNIDFCVQLANCFGITLDELLGIEYNFDVKKTVPAPNTGNENYSAEERQLIEIYRTLDDTMRETLWSLLNTWKPSYIPSIKKHSTQ